MSASESYKIGVSTTTVPGADSNTYVLFDSTTWPWGAGCLMEWASRVKLRLGNAAAGTLKAYSSVDKGTNWDQVGGNIAVAASSATDLNGPYDYLVDTYSDFRLSWVNGGSSQSTAWRPELTITRGDRAPGT